MIFIKIDILLNFEMSFWIYINTAESTSLLTVVVFNFVWYKENFEKKVQGDDWTYTSIINTFDLNFLKKHKQKCIKISERSLKI